MARGRSGPGGVLGPLSNHDRDAVTEEGAHLLKVAASDAKAHEIEFTVRR
jgi:hypothetical protein